MKTKNLLKKAFLLLALIGGASSAWADEVIFSATPIAAWSVPASTTDAEITSSYATISGGSMYLTNNQTGAKDMIKKQGEFAFQHTNNDTFFKVVLNKALQAGDVISARMQSRTDADLGLWFSTATSRPGSVTAKIDLATAASQAWVAAPTYTVQEGDGIIGKTTFYIYRGTGKSTYFNTFTITRPAPSTDPAISVSPTSVSIKAVESDVEVTQNVIVTGSNLTGSTLTATLSPAVAGLSVTLGSSTITDGSISTTATLHYTQTENASGSTTLTLSDGTTSKEVIVNYTASVVAWTLQTIDAPKTWDFSTLTGGKVYAGDDINVEQVYANITEIGCPATFDGTALAFTGQYPLRETKGVAQNGTLRFNTSVPGYIVVKFSDTGTGASATAVKRYLVVNGETTEYWASRQNNSTEPGVAYDERLNVTTDAIAVPAGDVTITGTSALVYQKVEFTPTVSKTITSAGWATFCSDQALDFSSSIANLTKAYLITGNEGSTLTLSQITGTIPANTGILLEGEGAVNIPVVATSSTDVSANKLVGVTTDTKFDQNTIYVLMNEGGNVGFYKNGNEEQFTVGANTAYLPANFAGSARSAFFFGGNITAVENVEAAAEVKALPVKRIVNGKLVIEKNGHKFNAAGALIY